MPIIAPATPCHCERSSPCTKPEVWQIHLPDLRRLAIRCLSHFPTSADLRKRRKNFCCLSAHLLSVAQTFFRASAHLRKRRKNFCEPSAHLLSVAPTFCTRPPTCGDIAKRQGKFSHERTPGVNKLSIHPRRKYSMRRGWMDKVRPRCIISAGWVIVHFEQITCSNTHACWQQHDDRRPWRGSR